MNGKRPFQGLALPEANGRGKRRNTGKPASVVRRDETVFRILCPASKTGSIIGRAGSIIKSIRNDTGASIRVEDAVQGCEERVVTISAKEHSSMTRKFRGQNVNVKELEEKVDYLSGTNEDREKGNEAQVGGERKEGEEKGGRDEEGNGVEWKEGEEKGGGDEEGKEEKESLAKRKEGEPKGAGYGKETERKTQGREGASAEGKEVEGTEIERDNGTAGEGNGTDTTNLDIVKSNQGIQGEGKQVEEKNAEGKREEGKIGEGTHLNPNMNVELREGDLSPAQEALLRVHARIMEGELLKPESTDQKEAESKIHARLLVPTSQVGCLLGKKGKIIERLREETGAQIRVLSRDQLPLCASPTDEVVQITGDLVAVRKALHAASSQMRHNPPKEQTQELGLVSPTVGSKLPSETMPLRSTFSMGNALGALADTGRPSSPRRCVGQSSGYSSEAYFIKEDVMFRLLCPKEKIGSIIGKGGSIVRSLCDETGAKISIDVSTSEGEERVVSVSAIETSEDTFSKAQKAVLIVHSRIIDSGVDKDGVITSKLLVPCDQAGCLIGKGGSIIKELRKTTRAKIGIHGKERLPPCALETDEIVEIRGNASVSQEALLQITSRLRSNLLYGKLEQVSPPSREGALPLRVGMMSGVGVSGNYYSPFSDIHTGIKTMLPPGLPGPWPLQDVGGRSLSGFSTLLQLNSTGNAARSNAPVVKSTTVEVVIPERVVGSILGESGTNLAQIRQISGANVKVHRLVPGASERIVEISGTPDKTHTAQSLLQAFILSGQ